jgi:2-octaprenyl-6-methoxyphenol hydroxylase
MLKKNNLFFKKKIILYTKNYLKNVKFTTNIEYKDLNFLIRNKYYLDRILLFGDALHMVHPFAGQGFNMTLRDLASLEKILTQKINLGLDIGSSDILSEFSSEIKPRNFAFSIGIDFLKNSFSYKKLRNDILKILNKSNIAKDILFNIANKGFRF